MFKMTKLLLLAIGSIIIGSCAEKSGELLSEDSLVLKHFTAKEAFELQTIHDFFIDHISTAEDKNSDEAAADLDVFLKDLKEEANSGTINIPISYEEEIELIQGLSPNLSTKIWDKDPKFGRLLIKIQSTYIKFLLEMGKNLPIVKDYAEEIQRSGCLGASVMASLLMFPEKYDTSINKIRLLIALHYITSDYNNNISKLVYGEV